MPQKGQTEGFCYVSEPVSIVWVLTSVVWAIEERGKKNA